MADWTPPSYAQEVEDTGDEWQPPSYASAVDDKEEEHKPGIFSKIINALKPAEKIHPGEGPKAKLDKFLSDVITTDKHPILKRFLTSQNPAEEPALPSVKEAGMKEPTTWGGGFLKGLYDEFVRPLSTANAAGASIILSKDSPFGKIPSKISELPIRQSSREIPYKVARDVPSNIPEDVSQFSDIKQPDVKTAVVDYVKKNSEAKMKDVKQFIDSVKAPPSDEASQMRASSLRAEDILPEEQDLFNKARTQKVKEAFKGEEPRYTPEDLAKADVEAKRLLETNASGKREKFVNPFEKKIEESSVEEWKPPEYAEETPKASIEEKPPTIEQEEWKSPEYAQPEEVSKAVEETPDDIVEMHGGLGGIKPSKRALEPNSGPYGTALDKLFQSLGKTSENRVQQDIINKTERARRFAASASVEDVGVAGASKSLSKLKGEFDKVDVEKLQMTQPQVDSLFTAVKRAKITEGEKARGYTALFKLFNGEGVPQRNELRILDDVFGNDFANKVTELHGGLGAVGLKISKMANTMKSMMSSIDLSFPLKQGIGMIHTPEWRNAATEQLKYFAKPEYYDAAMKAIEDRPKFLLGKESGLFLAKHGSLTDSEEAFANNYLGDFPKALRAPFDASERAYTGGLNKLRSDLFDRLTDLAEKAGNEVFASKGDVKVPTKIAENIANYINVFTGRGKLGKLEPIANELNTVFWSPRLLSSRLTALNPKFYYDLDPYTRKEAIKSLFAIASASTTINALGAVAGAKVGMNVLSSDFMKSRFSPSNNVLDPSGGFQQPIVAAARMIEEINRMATGGKQQYNKPGIPGIAGNFLVNKLSPLTGLAYDIASAKKFTGKGNYEDRFGQKKNILSEEGKRFVPMFIQDVYDIVNSDPSFAETVGLVPLTALGAGEQNYPEKQEKKKFLFRKPQLR